MSVQQLTKFPEAIDSSIIASFKSCPQLFKKSYIDNWKSKEGANVHLVAGGAFAKGIETARKAFFTGEHEVWRPAVKNPEGQIVMPADWYTIKGTPENRDYAAQAGIAALFAHYGDFECPPDSAKSAERTAGALEFYLASYPLNLNAGYPILLPGNRRAIEVNFVHPLPIDHPETGNPLLYCGRSDMLCNYAGDNYVEDDKTTTSLGATWSRQWDMRGQFLGYTWGFRQQGYRIAGVLVRGVSILKTKYDTQEAICNFSEFEVNRWYVELLEWIEDMKICFTTNRWRYNLDHACAEYGGCAFKTACKQQDEKPWLEQYFERRHWDPITRLERKL